ncbi:MAG: LPS export ABC transporter periplasmic protein LptC [Halanaerobium sp.]
MDKKHIFVALFLLIVIVISLYFTFEENPLAPEPEQPEEQGPEEELEDVGFSIYNRDQEHELILESENVDNYEGENRMELEPIEIKVYAADSEELLYTLNSDFGIYHSDREYIELSGNVKLDSDEYYAEADLLDYYIGDNHLEGRGNVFIEGSEFEADAEEFSSDLNLKDLKLSKTEDDGGASVFFEELNND